MKTAFRFPFRIAVRLSTTQKEEQGGLHVVMDGRPREPPQLTGKFRPGTTRKSARPASDRRHASPVIVGTEVFGSSGVAPSPAFSDWNCHAFHSSAKGNENP